MLGGVLISLLVAGSWRRLTAVAGYAVIGGLAIAGILQGWFGILQGDFWLNALAVGLSLFATAAFIVGMNALLGRAGIAVGAVLTVLVGNPISAAAQPLQFLVGPWGAVGQWFVPGASVTLLRDLSYFPDASSTFPWLVLLGWAAVGVVAMLAGHDQSDPLDAMSPVADTATVTQMIAATARVQVAPALRHYIVELVGSTRAIPEVRLGCSPRAALHLGRAAKAAAALDGREYVVPDDIQRLAAPVLAHRLLLTVEAHAAHRSAEDIIGALLGRVRVPLASGV